MLRSDPWAEANMFDRMEVESDDEDMEPWPIPDKDNMLARWKFRDKIVRETMEHRRVHETFAGESRRRNILEVLNDREKYGASGITSQRRRRRRSNYKGNRSPSTVFDSPVSTTSASLYQEAQEDDTVESILLSNRASLCFPSTILHEVQTYAEYCSALKYESAFLYHLGGNDELDEQGNRPQSSRAVSTISVAFSPDSKTMASTHGDHTVKITDCNSGILLQTLEGHPRTPWTVKYHPTDSAIVASGCLGHQVRIWNWHKKLCLQMIRLEYAIISLSFHPTGKVLAVANGTRLHFWAMDKVRNEREGNSLLTEMDQRHMLRCVHFTPNGHGLIIGGVNPTNEDARRRNRGGIGGGGMSFYLRLWDFDLERALNPQSDLAGNGISIARRPILNPRTFVPRALLYNDGGFDVSPDGKTLCACAEYWLPDGIDNAMQLLHREEQPYGAGDTEETKADEIDTDAILAETSVAVKAALTKLASTAGRSASFRDSMDLRAPRALPVAVPGTPPVPASDGPSASDNFVPQTPPNPALRERPSGLSPPSPPGRRFAGGLGQGGTGSTTTDTADTRGFSTPPPPPPPPAPQAPGGGNFRPPHPLSIVSRTGTYEETKGRYVPHVVTVSLDTTPIPEEVNVNLPRGKPYGAVPAGYRPRLGQLLEACPLDPSKASAVTCVKFSPSTGFCLIGYGVREPVMDHGGNFHPVTAVYRVKGGMTHVSTMLSGDDDVNIARFHPDSGQGFVYGTKQGRVRVLAPRPWNYYNC